MNRDKHGDNDYVVAVPRRRGDEPAAVKAVAVVVIRSPQARG